jgi:hypothetical protein
MTVQNETLLSCFSITPHTVLIKLGYKNIRQRLSLYNSILFEVDRAKICYVSPIMLYFTKQNEFVVNLCVEGVELSLEGCHSSSYRSGG